MLFLSQMSSSLVVVCLGAESLGSVSWWNHRWVSRSVVRREHIPEASTLRKRGPPFSSRTSAKAPSWHPGGTEKPRLRLPSTLRTKMRKGRPFSDAEDCNLQAPYSDDTPSYSRLPKPSRLFTLFSINLICPISPAPKGKLTLSKEQGLVEKMISKRFKCNKQLQPSWHNSYDS